MKATKPTKMLFLVAFFVCLTCKSATAECCTSVSAAQVVADYAVTSCEIPTTTYKVVCETVYDEQKVVRYKPVWETEIRQRPYTVSRQVPETAMKVERYKVRVPVTDVEIRDYSYERVRYVPETAMKDEISYVMRPVCRTYEKDEVYTVSRPVQETCMQTRQVTVNKQVTSYETKYVDQGAYTDQLVLKPNNGPFSNRLKFQEAKVCTDPVTGEVEKQRAGLYWVPSNKGRYEVSKIWVPNPQPVQVPRTYTVPETVCEQVPVTSTRYIQEQVVRKVPVTVTEMVREQVVRKVPHTTMKPVREVVENKVPVKVCRWQEEERVREVPYTSWKTICEQQVEEYQVKVCKMVAEEQVCRTPRVVQRYVPLDAMGCEIMTPAPRIVSPTPAVGAAAQEPSILTGDSDMPAPSLAPDAGGGKQTYESSEGYKVNSVLLPDEGAAKAPVKTGVAPIPAAKDDVPVL